MKRFLKTALIITSMGLSGCSDSKPRNFFAPNGISVGPPIALENDSYRIPMEFETFIIHSGCWIDTVEARKSGTSIQITAFFTHANREGRYPGYVELNGLPPGLYDLKYRDPNGTLHFLQQLELP